MLTPLTIALIITGWSLIMLFTLLFTLSRDLWRMWKKLPEKPFPLWAGCLLSLTFLIEGALLLTTGSVLTGGVLVGIGFVFITAVILRWQKARRILNEPTRGERQP